MRRAAALWVVFFGLYLLFAAPVSASELIAGVPSAMAVTAFALAYRRAEERRMDFRAVPWPRVVLRTLAAIPADAARVGGALARSLWQRREAHLGLSCYQPFRQGNAKVENARAGDAGAAEATRRAVVVLGTSLAPNGYVLMMPEGSEALVLHRLVLTPAQRDRNWPV